MTRFAFLISSYCSLGLLMAIYSGVACAQAREVVHPKPLAPGDTIMFVAPAGDLDRERIAVAKKRLETLGFNVRLPDTLFRKSGYLAGSDQQRADELNRAFADEQVDAIFPGTGGYGATRIVDLLDYEVIEANPKIFIGFSDVTALHLAIHQRTGLVTFHSPNPQWGLGSESDLAPFAKRLFWRALSPSKHRQHARLAELQGYVVRVDKTDDKVPQPTTVVRGVARGRIVGGNLSVIHALMGTAFEIDTAGKILFLEDVGEAPYRIDRMLQTLKLAGKLDRLAGLMLGSFTRRESENTRDEITTMDDVLRDFFLEAHYPVVSGFPVGHQRNNATLPIGVMAELNAGTKQVTLLESPVAR